MDEHRLITDDALLPGQFADLLRRTHARTPEQRLMLAMLEDALLCWMRAATVPTTHTYQPHNQPYVEWLADCRERDHNEANRWVFEDYESPLSFADVCEDLDIDCDWLRMRLRQWESADARHAA